MSDAQSNRSVLPFPGELRNKIYRNLVSKTYLALGTTPEHYLSAAKGNRKRFSASAGLVILQVSKATSAEALKLLYEESVFLFKLDFTTSFLCDDPPQRAVALMNNVSFDISATGSAAWQTSDFGMVPGKALQDLMSQRTIELFTGTACFRNILRVRFRDCTNRTHHWVSKRLDKAMKELTGFRKLVVEFEVPLNSASDLPWLTSEQAQAISRSQCELYKDLSLQSLFEPAYGSAVQGAGHDASNYTCYLEFHPRQYFAKGLIVKAAKMLEEAARLAAEEPSLASLPEIVETLKLL